MLCYANRPCNFLKYNKDLVNYFYANGLIRVINYRVRRKLNLRLPAIVAMGALLLSYGGSSDRGDNLICILLSS